MCKSTAIALAVWTTGSLLVPAAASASSNLVVLQVGDGVTPIVDSTAAAVTLKKFATTGGAAVETFAFPTSGAGVLTLGGTAVTEGKLTYNDGYLGLAGFAADVRTPGLTQTPTTGDGAILRRVLAFDADQPLSGGPVLGATTTAFSAANIRTSIVSGTNFYAVGGGNAYEGPVYIPDGAAADAGVLVADGLNNPRSIRIYNGNIYVAAQPTARGVYSVAGLPTTGGNPIAPAVLTPRAANNNVNITLGDFWISPDFSLAYVADEGTLGGIKKYVANGSGGFDLAYTISTDYDASGPAVTGTRTFAVDTSGANPVLFATSLDATRILSLTDTGDKTSADATLTTLLTADANTLFRGVALIPALTPPGITGDTNDDGVVDLVDLNNVLNNFGDTGTSPGDDNGDGAVDLVDLNNVLNNFGNTAAVAFSTVPEPSAVACVLAGFPLLTRRRVRQ